MRSVRTWEPGTRANYRIDSMPFLASENNKRRTDLDLPHTKFTATRWLRSVKTLSVKDIYSKTTALTLESNGSVVSKLIWLELKLNLSHAYFEKSLLDCQCSTAVDSKVTVQD